MNSGGFALQTHGVCLWRRLLFIEITPYLGTFIASDKGGAGVLTGGKFTDGGYDRVFDEGSCNEVIVFTGFWIVKNGGYLFEMSGAEIKGYIAESFIGELLKDFGFEDEHLFSVEGFGVNTFAGNMAPGFRFRDADRRGYIQMCS